MILTRLPPQLRIDDAVPLRSPGRVLQDDYLLPHAMSAAQRARRSGIPSWQRHRILAGTRINADEGFRVAVALRTSPLYWLLLQARYDLERIRREAVAGGLVVRGIEKGAECIS
ncbi:helix-turn-helix transcriptional regulator [Dyella telluris]|uniref:Addiction module antidote protein, HigA family n=1 Tax=Dyella telluris TaxID=2763498 RepID=A0A7G8Q7M9_9GAMM|nr:addiction module antidote protein, HigA family [Dyella telluris]QNK02787.1 addiction module antidote protein, HigA family [Dyella telluris]